MSTISVITPALITTDLEMDWLGEAIESVLSQDYKDWEMVIVNDGSELPFDPLRSAYPDPRIKWHHAAGLGPPRARNWAAHYATSKLLLPLDADDKFAPEALGKYLKAWERHGSGFVYPDVIMFDEDGQRNRPMSEYSFEFLLKRTYICIGALFLKSDWERVKGYKSSMRDGLEDWEFYVTLGENGVCGKRIPEFLYWYRQAPQGRTATLKADREKWHAAYDTLRELHADTFAGRWPVGCCGSGSVGRKTAPRGIKRVPVGDILEPMTIVYTGKRNGRFGITGARTKRRYQVTSRGAEVLVEAKDVPGFMGMKCFKVKPTPILEEKVAPAPKPEPVPAPVEVAAPPEPERVLLSVPEPESAWPEPMPEPLPEGVVIGEGLGPEPREAEAEVEPLAETDLFDISTFTVKQIQQMDLKGSILDTLWLQEFQGKNRTGVIKHLEKLMDRALDEK